MPGFVARAVLPLVVTAALIACGGDGVAPDRGPVASIAITPAAVTVIPGGSVQLHAAVRDGAGTPLTDQHVFWSSEDAAVATVDSDGTVTGVATGSTRISASAEGKSALATITVSPTPVASIRITPSGARLQVGGSTRFQAETFDGSGAPLAGRAVAWSVADATIATVTASGVVTAVAPGGTLITATSEGKSASAAVTVSAVPVAAVVLTTARDTIFTGQSTQLTAQARDAAGNVLSARLIEWRTSDASVATVSSNGLVIGLAVGTAAITATCEGASAQATIVVRPQPVATVVLSPATSGIIVGDSVQLSVQLRDANGRALTGRVVTYASSDPAVATVSAAGLVTGIAPGNAVITATSEGKAGTADVRVAPIPVATVRIAPAPIVATAGTSVQLTATALSASGATLGGRAVTWASSAPAVITVSAAGLASAIAPGTATITATIDGVNGFASADVRPAPVASVTVAPSTAALRVGQTAQLGATVLDTQGNVVSGATVSWQTSNGTVATVSANGLVSAVGAGSATITAAAQGKQGSAAITVTADPPRVPVASVDVTPSVASVKKNQRVQLTATPRDANGNALSGRTITWSTSNGAIATVDSGGTVHGVRSGVVTITATSEGKSGTALVTVQ